MGLFGKSGAIFSDCGRYRYKLWRLWGPGPIWVFFMLNPSKAGASDNDPTVERCIRRAMAGGAGGIIVVNLFAWKSTDPAELRTAADPIGPDNDRYIREAVAEALASGGLVICAWGGEARKNKDLRERPVQVLKFLEGLALHVLRLTKDGDPYHPLYVGYDRQPFRWTR